MKKYRSAIMMTVFAIFLIFLINVFNFSGKFEQYKKSQHNLSLDVKDITLCPIDDTTSIFYYLDSFCYLYDVNPDFVFDIGDNESNWLYPDSIIYVRQCGIKNENSYGDLQLNSRLLQHYKMTHIYNNRIELLHLGIKHIKYLQDKYKGNLVKVRYVYGRGHWKPEHKWSELEKEFMSKMNWDYY
jgi:hypothetical protein